MPFLGYNSLFAPQLQKTSYAQAYGSGKGAADAQRFSDPNKRTNDLLEALGFNESTNKRMANFDPNGFFGKSLSGSVGGGAGGDEYGGILETQQGHLTDLLSDLQGYGGAQRSRIGSQYDSAKNTELARLESRGLGASNLGAAAVGGIEDKRQQSLLDLEDSLLRNKIGVKQQGYGGIENTMGQQVGLDFEKQKQQQQMLQSLLGMFNK